MASGTPRKASRRKPANPHKAPAYKPQVVDGERIVDDPYQPGAKLRARVNLSEHPLELMRARGRIDNAQYEAGVRFRAIYERASIGPHGAIDPARIRVDGGKPGDTFTDDVAMAINDLRNLSRQLGMVGYRVLQAVAGQGESVSSLAARWPGPAAVRAKQDYLNLRVIETLETLALDVWGVAACK